VPHPSVRPRKHSTIAALLMLGLASGACAQTAADLKPLLQSNVTLLSKGGLAVYNVGFENLGPGPSAAGRAVDFVAPSGARVIDAAGGYVWTCSHTLDTAHCALAPEVPAGWSASFQVLVLAPTVPGNALAMAVLTDEDGDTSNNGRNLIIPVLDAPSAADLAIQVTTSAPNVVAGDEFTWQAQVSNVGQNPSAGPIEVRSRLPASLEWIGVEQVNEWNCILDLDLLHCSLKLGAIDNGSITGATPPPPIVVHVRSKNLDNPVQIEASVSAQADADTANNADGVAQFVFPPPVELGLWMDQAPPQLAVGQAYGYTLAMKNSGSANDASLTHIVADLQGATLTSAGAAGWTCQLDAGTHLDCSRTGLSAGEVSTLSIQATASMQAGTASLSAQVQRDQGGDPLPGNDTVASDIAIHAPDLAISEMAPGWPSTTPLGASPVYRLAVANLSSIADATGGITVTHAFPPQLAAQSASGTGWTCATSTQLVTCTRPGLAAGTTAPAIDVTTTAVAVGTQSSLATVWNALDANADNDAAQIMVRVVAPPNHTPLVPANQHFSVPETALPFTIAGAVAATDEDGDGLTYSMPNAATLPFDVVAATGEIVVDGALDYETAPLFQNVYVAVTDGKATVIEAVSIAVVDIGGPDDIEHTPVVPPGQKFAVSENVTLGTAVGVVQASDEDPDDTLSFALPDAAALPFAIDAATGQISVDGALDFETTAAYPDLEVTVSDGTATVSTILNIDVKDFGGPDDINQAPAIAPSQIFHVSEAATPNTVVGVLQAVDADPNDSLVFAMPTDALLPFTIDPANGILRVDASLDFETIPLYATVVVTVSDGTAIAVGAITIVVDDFGGTDDQNVAPAIPAGQTFHVAETAAAGASLGFIEANDPDPADGLSFSLPNDAVLPFTVIAATGELIVDGALDFETAPAFPAVTVQVSDGFASSTHTVSILVDDVGGPDDINGAPVVGPGQVFAIAENSALGSFIGTLQADDADPADILVFSLPGDALLPFTIDPASGALEVDGPLDFETAPLFAGVLVQVSDGVLASTQTITIQITDVGGPDDTGNGNGGNTAPVANDDFFWALPQMATVFPPGTLFANDLDADGDTLTATRVGTTTPAGALVTVQPDGGFTLQPPAGLLDGIVDFDYHVDDGHGGSDEAHVAVLVNGGRVFRDGFESP
jgi:hypothetical protein